MHLSSSKITSKGQVTIPVEIRNDMGLEPGTDVVFIELDGMVLMKRTEDVLDAFGLFEKKAKKEGMTKEKLKTIVEEQKRKTWKKDYA